MSKERKLGRGLSTLLERVADLNDRVSPDSANHLSIVASEDGEQDEQRAHALASGAPQKIAIDLIDANPWQPRLDFDENELTELADSLKRHGLIQPIVVRRRDSRFVLVAGERRLRAARLAGWTDIPACFLDVTDQEMAELALTENMQRKDLNAIEKANAFKNYIDQYGGTHEELGQRIGMSRGAVTNLMRLLDLPNEIQQAVRRNDISSGHARAILPIDEEKQFQIVRRIISEGWSVRQTEAYVAQLVQGDQNPSVHVGGRGTRSHQTPQVRELEQQFRSALGLKVQLTSADGTRGKLVIPFISVDEFERVYRLICPSHGPARD